MMQDSADLLDPWMAERLARRRFDRWHIGRRANVVAAGVSQGCVIEDISPAGARVSTEQLPGPDASAFVVLNIEDFGALASEIWHRCESSNSVGLLFLHGPGKQAALAEWLTSERAHRAG